MAYDDIGARPLEVALIKRVAILVLWVSVVCFVSPIEALAVEPLASETESVHLAASPSKRVKKKKRRSRRRRSRRRRARRQPTALPFSSVPLRLGMQSGLGGMFSTVSYSSKLSAGLGVGFSLVLIKGLSDRFYLTGGAGYRLMTLDRTIEGTDGVLVDPSTISVSQKQSTVTGRLLVGYALRPMVSELVGYAVEAGVEYAHGISGTQTTVNPANSQNVTPVNYLFALAGIAGSLQISHRWVLQGALHGALNLAIQDSTTFEARLSLALQYRV